MSSGSARRHIQLLVGEADDIEVEVFLLERLQLDAQHLLVPPGVERQLVVGQHERAPLRLGEVVEDDHWHFGNAELARRQQARVAAMIISSAPTRTGSSNRTRRCWRPPARPFVAVRPRVPGVRQELIDRPTSSRPDRAGAAQARRSRTYASGPLDTMLPPRSPTPRSCATLFSVSRRQALRALSARPRPGRVAFGGGTDADRGGPQGGGVSAGELRYSLDLGRDTGLDPLEDFLFERKTGNCEYFAASLVVLARAAGIPARVVNGFQRGDGTSWGSIWPCASATLTLGRRSTFPRPAG